MIRALIFDLDGLLADAECLHCCAYQMALLQHAIALRDAEHWVRFGKGIAGWLTTPNPYTRHHDFSKASRVCVFLTEITDDLQNLVAAPLDLPS